MRSPKPSESELSLLALITKEILVPNGELSPVGDERVAGARVSDRPMFLQTSRANREVTSRGDFRSQISDLRLKAISLVLPLLKSWRVFDLRSAI